ncbi:hypothetical protein JaAD80_03480 [Janthinobacterium sp. AD80]|nr:hypothetical protein JaAD80_03480 [Janthinobacterium sp. AD80]
MPGYKPPAAMVRIGEASSTQLCRSDFSHPVKPHFFVGKRALPPRSAHEISALRPPARSCSYSQLRHHPAGRGMLQFIQSVDAHALPTTTGHPWWPPMIGLRLFRCGQVKKKEGAQKHEGQQGWDKQIHQRPVVHDGPWTRLTRQDVQLETVAVSARWTLIKVMRRRYCESASAAQKKARCGSGLNLFPWRR